MSNTFAVSNLISKSMTQFWEQKNPILNTGNRTYVETFTQQNYATGGTIDIKIPAYPVVQFGLTTTATGIEDLVVAYTINPNVDMYNVVRELSLIEQRFDILGGTGALTKNVKQAIVDNYAYPAYQAIATQVEFTAASRLNTNAFLTPIDTVDKLGGVNTFSSISQVTAMMDLLQFPAMGRVMMMNVGDARLVADSLQNMFNESINKNITMTARIGGPDKGRLAGLDLFQSSQIQKHIAGPLAGTTGITVSSVSADGTQITLTGVPSETSQLINAGDMISIPSVNLAQNISAIELPFKLVVTAAQNANGDGAGNVVVTLPYPLMASGEHINVTSLPANGAPVFVYPDYNPNYAYVNSGLCVVPLPLGDIYGATNSQNMGDNKVPTKVVLQGNVSTFQNIFRTTQLIGIKVISPYVIALPSRAV